MVATPSNLFLRGKKVLDPITGQQVGWYFYSTVSAALPLQAQILFDEESPGDITVTQVSASPPTIAFSGFEIPRDGLSHTIGFQVRQVDTSGEGPVYSNWVSTNRVAVVMPLEPPTSPVSINATVTRVGDAVAPDRTDVAWTLQADCGADIYFQDHTGKRRIVCDADPTDRSVTLEGMRKYLPAGAVARACKFGVATKNRTTQSEILWSATVSITGAPADVAVQTPDEIAGTVQNLTTSQLITAITTTPESAIAAANVLSAITTKIRDVVAKGGSVSIENIGVFSAKWSAETTKYSKGQWITVDPARSAAFSMAMGLEIGTKLGHVLSDSEAAALK